MTLHGMIEIVDDPKAFRELRGDLGLGWRVACSHCGWTLDEWYGRRIETDFERIGLAPLGIRRVDAHNDLEAVCAVHRWLTHGDRAEPLYIGTPVPWSARRDYGRVTHRWFDSDFQ